MSVQAFSWVLEWSEAQGLERLVLQSHANNARGHEPPWRSWTGIDTVVHESRATRRGVQKATQRLVAEKRLLPTGEKRGNGTLVYVIAVDAEADRVDREARLAREEQERKRSRRGANRVRPSDSADSDGDEGELHSPPAGELGSPAEGEQDSPAEANMETPGGEHEDASAEQSSPKPSVTAEPSAANAAAASADAPDASSDAAEGSSSNPNPSIHPSWPDARSALIAGGLSAELVDAHRADVCRELRRRGQAVDAIVWSEVGDTIAANWSRIQSTEPAPILRFALNQRFVAPKPEAPAAAQNAQVNDRLEIPQPTEAATTAWAEVSEGLLENKRFADEGPSGSLVEAVQPLRCANGVLWITATHHAAHWVENKLMPWIRWYVAEAGISGQVEWVPRDQAAVRRAA